MLFLASLIVAWITALVYAGSAIFTLSLHDALSERCPDSNYEPCRPWTIGLVALSSVGLSLYTSYYPTKSQDRGRDLLTGYRILSLSSAVAYRRVWYHTMQQKRHAAEIDVFKGAINTSGKAELPAAANEININTVPMSTSSPPALDLNQPVFQNGVWYSPNTPQTLPAEVSGIHSGERDTRTVELLSYPMPVELDEAGVRRTGELE